MRPIARIGEVPRTRPQPRLGAAQPAPITSAAPTVGSSAATPGYSVAALNRVQATRINPSPAHPVMTAARAGRRRHWSAARAPSPPRAHCQALVGSEKNAAAGTTYVATNDSANDRAAITARTAT